VKPATRETIEGDLRVALDRDDAGLIGCLGKLLDQLDVAEPPPSMLEAAFDYASRGLQVFPLSPGTKVPYKGTHGVDMATNDLEFVMACFEEMPRSNIAIATGHLVDVIDIDGPAGVESMVHELYDDDGWTGPPVIGKVSTPRAGGIHLYIAAEAGHGNRAHMLPGIDYRGLGGYVVAPPSTTATGLYEWTRPLRLETT